MKILSTYALDADRPTWAPLEHVARLARRSRALPSFHPGEFMHMMSVEAERSVVRIHLYKHRDTRCYLNLDDAGHAYRYLGSDPDRDLDARPWHTGYYARHRSLAEAIALVEFDQFQRTPPLYRSYPPEEWPDDDDAIAPRTARRQGI